MDQQSDRGYIYGEQIDMPVLAPNDPCSCVVCHDIYDAEEDMILDRIHEVDGETVCSDCRTGYAKKVLAGDMQTLEWAVKKLYEDFAKDVAHLKLDGVTDIPAKFDDLLYAIEKERKEFGGKCDVK